MFLLWPSSPSDGATNARLCARSACARSASPTSVVVVDEGRMPEVFSRDWSSPGPRQKEKVKAFAPTPLSPPRTPLPPPRAAPRARPRRRTTAAEAYNKGLLFQYLVDSASEFDPCGWDSTVDYERSWTGHQPLSPSTWDTEPEDDGVSASELRLMRRRRRMGVVSPPRAGGRASSVVSAGFERSEFFTVHNRLQEPKDLPGCSIAFPEELLDPHTQVNDKWHPSEATVSSSGSSSGEGPAAPLSE